MKFTYNWIKKYLNTKATPAEIADKLTLIGLEIEEMQNQEEALKDFLIGEIISAEKHPNADRLKVLKVSQGEGKPVLNIVCGAPNARAGIKGVLSLPGMIIPDTGEKLKKGSIRGIESQGMMCSMRELKLGTDHDGIIEFPEEIANKISAGDKAIDALKQIYNIDTIFDGEITSNRGDYLGVNGIARDLCAAGLGEYKKQQIPEIKEELENPIKVNITNEEACKAYTGIYIQDVKNCESPKWLKDLLISIGLKPISAIVDISNYISFDMARPLHMFDADKIKDNTLNVGYANKNSKLLALDDKEYDITNEDIVISSGNNQDKIEGLAGIIGGKDSAITEETKNIFIESALFNAIPIRKTSARLKINTDAKYRFERFVSPNSTLPGLKFAAQMVMDICGGKASKIITVGEIPTNENKIKYPIAHFEKTIGITMPTEKMIEILQNLNCKVEKDSDGLHLNIITNPERGDLKEVHDITEELIRIYGYENIPILPVKKKELIRQTLTTQQKQISTIRKALCCNGLMDICSSEFASSEKTKLFISENQNLVYVSNPISSDLDCMRPTLIPNLLSAVAYNASKSMPDIAMFEIGSVFYGSNPGEEDISIAGIRSGLNIKKHWLNRSRKVDVFDIKSDLYCAFENAGFNPEKLTIIQYADKIPSFLNPNKSGVVIFGQNQIGYFGEIHPLILKQYDIKNINVVCFEFNLSKLPEIKEDKTTTKGSYIVSNLQQVSRDFSFVVDKTVCGNDLIKSIKKTSELIKEISIFDVYENAETYGEDKKSIAVNIVLKPSDKTLTDEEINIISDKIIQNIKTNLNGVLLKDFIRS